MIGTLMATRLRRSSLRARLLTGLLVPVALFILMNSISVYHQALEAATIAYDRTLLASAKTISEQLGVVGYDEHARIQAAVPYSALEAFEADNQSRMVYRVSSQSGEMISGYADLPFWRGTLPLRSPYAALVDFYDVQFESTPVRVAVLLQPVVSPDGRGMAVVQVAETLELRQALARKLLLNMVWRQLLLLAVVAAVTVLVVHSVTRPVRALGSAIERRAPNDLSPIYAPDAPRELQPLVDAMTGVMSRLQRLLDHQKRFVRDAAHQLRTPLAVLKTQLQSAHRGDVAVDVALSEIGVTVERATTLVNQMLSLAKIEQLRQQPESSSLDLADSVREVALDLSPLIADKALDFDLYAQSARVNAHPWMLRELSRNLLHNAIKHSPPGAALTVYVRAEGAHALLHIRDQGPGISATLRQQLFTPFAAGNVLTGSGLGLAICHEIVLTLHGEITLDNRPSPGPENERVDGLDTVVRLPCVS